MSLHDELARLADTAHRPAIDHAVWDRGRTLRRRDRLATSAVVLAMVLVLGGLATLIIGPPQAVAPADDPVPDGAIPSAIRDVPTGADLALETDLAIGPGSVAFVSSDGMPVVIGAGNGTYHLLDLPAWRSGTDGLALSPNGRRLAWQSTDAAGTVISVLDLTTGIVTDIGVGGRPDVDVRTISWSPDSSLVGTIGDRSTAPRTVVALVDAQAGTGTTVLTSSADTLAGQAVADDGTVALARGDGSTTAVLPDGTERDFAAETLGGGGPGAFSPDGGWLALATPPGTASSSLRLVGGGTLEQHPFPADTIAEAAVRPLGWLDDRLQLLLVQPTDGADPELVVTTPEVNDTSTWRGPVGSVDPEVATTLSVAVDLVPDLDGTSSQQLTHDFGEPGWAGQRDVSWVIGLGVAAAAGVLLGLRWLWRRRTRFA